MKETFTFSEFFAICRSKWKWFAYSVVTFVLLAVLYILITPPQYTREAEVMVKDEDKNGMLSSAMSSFAGLGLFGASSNVYNELYVFQSKYLLLNVVKRMHLDVKYIIKGLCDKDLYGKDLPIVVTFQNFTDDDKGKFKMDLKKDGSFQLYGFKKNKDSYDDEVSGNINSTVKTPIGKLYIAATPFLKNLKEDVTINISKKEPIMTVEDIEKIYSATVTSRDADIIKLAVRDVSKERAVDFLNTIISVYRENKLIEKKALTESSTQFINQRLQSIEQELALLDGDISAYMSKNKVAPDVEGSAKFLVENAATSETELVKMSSQLQMAQLVLNHLKDHSKKNEMLPVGMLPNDLSVNEQIVEYNKILLQRNKIAASSSDQNPLVRDYDQQLANLRGSIQQAINNGVNQLKIGLKGAEQTAGKANSLLTETPIKATKLLSMERLRRVKQELYVYLLGRLEENNLATEKTGKNVSVLTPPLGSKKPTSPIKRNILMGAFLAGLFLPACILFVRRRMGYTDLKKSA